MESREAVAAAAGYPARLLSLLVGAVVQILRSPSHSRRAAAARYWARRALLLTAIMAGAIVGLMYALDAIEIGLMPPRGTAALWPVRILTDFGKSNYVLSALVAILIVIALLLSTLRGVGRRVLVSVGIRMQFVFLSVLLPVLAGEVIKGAVGRGRPFVGGSANPFNFSLLSWKEAYSSFPSGHATTAFALAFAIAALWPRARGVMIAYALLICASRLVLLAHHPSDVVAGALLGLVGAMAVRYWFAARHLAFIIRHDGRIDPLPGPSWSRLKKVARGAIAP
ncbi:MULTISPECIES: phosphatase PAP2 family protein [Rhodopseudomonas]|uniref:Phosphoesterase n=1 Tax=Rhodopseudomonas palustris TaxID=1076 RepID=A0A0D7F7R4_RHOPL|nr:MULTISPECIES: phosphatase PAP2 family protein [Rhodopseudomonas]KIZ47742.1 phosphoesterase [Rhodopseudomonas palustris]MDF3813667.1 phosphatase PAP2 family protein [Rhodopseudomonas sp. BAL398]WOK18797.1 phosphatase PAP2 family protein [Rhodopseudomonas sp. BAL398]